MPRFNLQDYTNVNDRMKMAEGLWESITVSEPKMLTETQGYVTATIILKDGRHVTEIARFAFGLQGPSAQAMFPLEDAATSAVGRALGRFGFGTSDFFPSREEMEQVEAITPGPVVEVGLDDAMMSELRAQLREARTTLVNMGGKPRDLKSSQVAAMSITELQAEIAGTQKALAWQVQQGLAIAAELSPQE